MTQSRILFALFAVCLSAVLYVGCDSGTAVVKDKYNQLDKYLKDATVLERARDKLAKAKQHRDNTAEIAKKYRIDAEVAKRQAVRIEEAFQTSKSAFVTTQEAAKKADLPKLLDAKQEDKDKKVTIGATQYTGSQVYAMLQKYKDEVKKGEERAKIERVRSATLSSFADTAEKVLTGIDDDVAKMENKIAEYEMYKEMADAKKQLSAIGLGDSTVDSLLNTDSMMSELLKAVDTESTKISEGIPPIPKAEDIVAPAYSITDDDLL